MYKIDRDEKAITRILQQLSYKTSRWPEKEDPFCDKILFQRFGSELREEDLEQSTVLFKDFSLRDRNEAKKNSSGSSEVIYEGNLFKFQLDVWPFKFGELSVIENPDKFIFITGKHEERFEDGSQCARSFERYYRIPKGSEVKDGVYCNGILTIPVTRKENVDGSRKMRIVPITLVTSKENGSTPSKGQVSHAAIIDDVRQVKIINADSDNSELDERVSKSPEGELSACEDSKTSKGENEVNIENLMKIMTSEDPRIKANEVIQSAKKTICEAYESMISKSGKSVQETMESVEKSSVSNADSKDFVATEKENKKSELERIGDD